MKRFTIAVALVATLSFVGSAQALDPAPAGTAIATIDGVTGAVTVSVTDVTNWFIQSPSGAFSGPDDAAPPLPQSIGGFGSDTDSVIGETALTTFSYTHLFLGNVVNPGSQNDFTITWNAALGDEAQSSPVNFVPEPATLALAGISLCGLLVTRRRRTV